MISKHYVLNIIATLISMAWPCSEVTAQNRISARSLIKSVDSLAVTLASNAKLARISSSDIDTSGKSNTWTYIYFSSDTSGQHNSKKYFLIVQNSQITFDHLEPLGVGPWRLINWWMDSDSALSIAQTTGGADIKKRFPTCTIAASLFQWSFPPFISEWQIDYHCSDTIRTIPINATTGQVVTSVKEAISPFPKQFELHQNYPNPFNPSTTISFDLQSRSFVSLTVFNSIGQEVALLVNQELHPGDYSYQFNTSDLPSGVYFYRLQAGSDIDTKKFTLLK